MSVIPKTKPNSILTAQELFFSFQKEIKETDLVKNRLLKDRNEILDLFLEEIKEKAEKKGLIKFFLYEQDRRNLLYELFGFTKGEEIFSNEIKILKDDLSFDIADIKTALSALEIECNMSFSIDIYAEGQKKKSYIFSLKKLFGEVLPPEPKEENDGLPM